MRHVMKATVVLVTAAGMLIACGGGVRSSSSPDPAASPAVPAAPLPSVTADVLTYHNNNERTGEYLSETRLTTANVNVNTFGKLFFMPTNGKVDAQPLYVSRLALPDGTSPNVLYVATEHDTVYAFNADSGALIWQVSVLGPGETTSDPRGCDQVVPEIGITATPVIDRKAGPHGSLYVVAMSKDNSGRYFHRLHALDLATGVEQFGGPRNIEAHYPGTGDGSSGQTVIFDPKQYKERAGLLLVNGIIYTSWASHCDIRPYTGWMIGYDEQTLGQVRVLNLTPNGNGGALWNSGAAPAADDSGNIYALEANGSFETDTDAAGMPRGGDFGNAFVKLSTANGGLTVADYFAMYNTIAESAIDEDLGSGGVLLLPDVKSADGNTERLAVGAGKDGNIYIVNRENMGKFKPSDNGNVHQALAAALPGSEFGMPAYTGGRLYFGDVRGHLKAFRLSGDLLSATAESKSGDTFPYPGTTPSVSGNGSRGTIVWAAANATVAVLHAYDASDLASELYNSNQAVAERDHFGHGNKFIVPTVANGRVYVGTVNGVAAFGLLPGR